MARIVSILRLLWHSLPKLINPKKWIAWLAKVPENEKNLVRFIARSKSRGYGLSLLLPEVFTTRYPKFITRKLPVTQILYKIHKNFMLTGLWCSYLYNPFQPTLSQISNICRFHTTDVDPPRSYSVILKCVLATIPSVVMLSLFLLWNLIPSTSSRRKGEGLQFIRVDANITSDAWLGTAGGAR